MVVDTTAFVVVVTDGVFLVTVVTGDFVVVVVVVFAVVVVVVVGAFVVVEGATRFTFPAVVQETGKLAEHHARAMGYRETNGNNSP